MKSVISSAVLGAASMAQIAYSASIHHAHHHRRAPASIIQERAPTVGYISATDISSLDTKGIKVGVNAVCTESSAYVAIGDSGPFTVQAVNNGTEELVLVVWAANTGAGSVDAGFVGANQAAITHTIQAKTWTTISFDTSLSGTGQISGAMSPVYGNTTLTPFSGQVDNTWIEFTFTNASDFSTTDVSRLINMDGSLVVVENYASAADAASSATPACTATNTQCAFVCADGATTCDAGTITGCTAGTADTTSDASGADGGCSGLTATGGHVVVTFL